MPYTRHERLVSGARSRPELWRTALGAGLTLALYIGLLYALAGVLVLLFGPARGGRIAAEIFAGETAFGTLGVLFTFGFLAAGPLLLARPLHGRTAAGLFGPAVRAMRDFLVTLRALALLAAVLWVALPTGVETEPGLALHDWVVLLPFTLAAILVQSGSEELVFRGYLQSQLAARFAAPAVWMGVPAALFALGHYAPDQTGETALWLAALAFAFGLAAADLTARTGTLGAAMALHFVNNFLALAVTALPGPMSGLALATYPFEIADSAALHPLLWLDLAVIGLSWLAARVALRV